MNSQKIEMDTMNNTTPLQRRFVSRWFMPVLLQLLLVLGLGALTTYVNANEQVTYLHNDALGSPAAATDAQGALLWKEAYHPYGDQIRKEDGGTHDNWFTGKPYDKDIGLSYFGARWYDPTIGRFMAMDPVGFKEGNIHSFNRYAYANGNPYKFVDPDGRDTVTFGPTIHIPGMLLNKLGVGEVPVSGFHAGVAFSFPGPWSPDAKFDIGVYTGFDVPALDVGFGRATVDIGYNSGSVSDLNEGSYELSVTRKSRNFAVSIDANSLDKEGVVVPTGFKYGRGVALGKMMKGLRKFADRLGDKNPLKKPLETAISTNVSGSYQKTNVWSLGGDK